MTSGRQSGWCALFVRAASPGAVFRFLQRRSAGLPDETARLDAFDLLLSDAVLPDGWRVLVADPLARVWMEAIGPALARALATPATLVFADEQRATWAFVRWTENGEQSDAKSEEVPARNGLRARLFGVGGPGVQAARWARDQNLPVARVPTAGRQSPPIVDYLTVAGLDQRGLLIEDSPRLYRFMMRGS